MDFYRGTALIFLVGLAFGAYDLVYTWQEVRRPPVPVARFHPSSSWRTALSSWITPWELAHLQGDPDLVHAVNWTPGAAKTGSGPLFLALLPNRTDAERASAAVVVKRTDPRARPDVNYGTYYSKLLSNGQERVAFRPFPANAKVITGMVSSLPAEYRSVARQLALSNNCQLALMDLEQPAPEQYGAWFFIVVFGFALTFLRLTIGISRNPVERDPTENPRGKPWTVLHTDPVAGWHIWPPFIGLVGLLFFVCLARTFRSPWLSPLLVDWLPVCLLVYAVLPALLIILMAASYRETLLCDRGLVQRNQLTAFARVLPWAKLKHIKIKPPTLLYPGGIIVAERTGGLSSVKIPLYAPPPPILVEKILARFQK
jgi:hypothetical protein